MNHVDKRRKVFLGRPSIKEIDMLLEVEKRAWSTIGENISASKDKLSLRVNDGQSVVLATSNGDPAGTQYAFRFNWNGDYDLLTSWDELTGEGWTNKVHNPTGDTGFLVGVGVVPEFRKKRFLHNLRWEGEFRISELLIALTLDNLFTSGVEKVIANARIPLYHTRPSLSVEEYCQLRRDDGLLYDSVLRFHEKMGAVIIKPVLYSMEDVESLNGGCWVLYKHPFKG
jgi:hypothetical protein